MVVFKYHDINSLLFITCEIIIQFPKISILIISNLIGKNAC